MALAGLLAADRAAPSPSPASSPGRTGTPTTATGSGGRRVALRFKKSGSSTYTTVKTVSTDSSGELGTTVTANSAGTWRRTFAGTGTTSGATAYGDSVAFGWIGSGTRPGPAPVKGEGPRHGDGALLDVRVRSAALAGIARLAAAAAAGAAAAGAEQREIFDLGGLLGVAVLGRVGRAGGFGHGSLLQARRRPTHTAPHSSCRPSHAQ